MSLTPSIYESDIQDAIHHISAWDIDEDAFPDAVNAQARIMAGCCSDEHWLYEHNFDLAS